MLTVLTLIAEMYNDFSVAISAYRHSSHEALPYSRLCQLNILLCAFVIIGYTAHCGSCPFLYPTPSVYSVCGLLNQKQKG